VSGELVAVNEELETSPELINDDCYGKGWMYKIKPSDMAEVQELIHGPDAVKEWLLAEIEKYAEE
jgi:glycine cleavage system H protein